jgi:hypothetical protein
MAKNGQKIDFQIAFPAGQLSQIVFHEITKIMTGGRIQGTNAMIFEILSSKIWRFVHKILLVFCRQLFRALPIY